jgi:hypothetical protein
MGGSTASPALNSILTGHQPTYTYKSIHLNIFEASRREQDVKGGSSGKIMFSPLRRVTTFRLGKIHVGEFVAKLEDASDHQA